MIIRKTAESVEEVEYEAEKNLAEAKTVEGKEEECSYSNLLRKETF